MLYKMFGGSISEQINMGILAKVAQPKKNQDSMVTGHWLLVDDLLEGPRDPTAFTVCCLDPGLSLTPI